MASNINITELDFDQIKTNIKNYLKTTSDFRDYDFEGSNLSMLIDVLAYNTYYNGYYLNMVANEMFLDSAVLRESLLSRAKELNYVPRSAVAARAVVSLSIAASGNPSSIIIPKGTSFTAEVGDDTYTFSTNQAYNALPVAGSYVVDDVVLFEGEILSYTFPAHNANQAQRYVIPNDNVDISLVTVTVQNSLSDSRTTGYTKASTLFGLTSTSTNFFLQPFAGNQYEIVFGDGNFGRALTTGNIVTVDYKATEGDRANGADEFTYVGGIDDVIGVTATTTSVAAGGAFEESNDSIRFKAPRHYSTQYRAVTANDYKSIIEEKFPDFTSVRAYGGEDVNPPQYGKVYIAIRPSIGEVLTDYQKEEVLAYLKQRSILSIRPEIIDPNYIYLGLNYQINYDPDKTTKSAVGLAALVRQEILRFGQDNLGKFNSTLRASKLAAQIDALDTSILGSGGSFTINKRLFPSLGTEYSVSIELNNAIAVSDIGHERHAGHVPSVYSSGITFQGEEAFIKDDGAGLLYIYNFKTDGSEKILDPAIGTVDYASGKIVINKLNISNYTGNYLTIYSRPRIFDVVPKNNQIIVIDVADVNVSAIPETTVVNV